MISSDAMRGYNDVILLSILTKGDSYGYEISKRIREISKDRYHIKETTLYSAFRRLEKEGYVESYDGTETFGKPRTYFSITEKGNAFYQSQCRQWREAADIIDCFLGGEQHG